MNKDQLQFAYSSKFQSTPAMKDSKILQFSSKEITRIISLGFNMKLVLMQIDGIKIVEEMIKIIRKMNSASFIYKQHMDYVSAKLSRSVNGTYDDFGTQPQLNTRKSEKVLEKQTNVESLQVHREQLIQYIVEQLYNARQDALRIGQADSSLNFTCNEDSLMEKEKELKQFVNSYKRDSESDNQVQELKRSIARIENDSKVYKKMVEDMTKTCIEKDQKIQSLKNTISKLEELIIKQVTIQGQGEPKFTSSERNRSSENDSDRMRQGNEPALIRSQALEREVIQLKSEIESLRENLAQSARLIKKDNQKLKIIESQRESQFLALSREYAVMKKQINELAKPEKRVQINFKMSSDDESKCSENDDGNFKVQLDLLKENYRSLNNAYITLKQQYSKIASKEPPIIKKESDFSVSSPIMQPQQASKKLKIKINPKTSSDPRQNKMKISHKKLEFGSDEEQIMRDINEINKIESMSQSIGISSFQSIIDAAEMTKKIQGFQYSNSIIHKVNSSKFIQTFQAKLSLILQYVCIIELYFAKNFLSCIREELMMEDSITIKSITFADLNLTLFNDPQAQESSFNANNSSKLSIVSSPNRITTNPTRQDANRNQSPIGDLSDSAISLPAPNVHSPEKQKTKKKIQTLQSQMNEISSLITDDYLNPHELRQDPDFITRVQKLKSNRIAVVITNLVKENEVFKKCLNQMIKSEQNFTKENNEIYFDEDGQLRRRSSSTGMAKAGSMGPDKKSKQNQNCSLM